MAIKHGREQSHFTQVPNKLIVDTRLTAKARLIVIYIIGHPEDWTVMHSDISERLGMSEPTVRDAMEQIVEVGYATRGERVKRPNPNGGMHLAEYDYTVYSYSLKDEEELSQKVKDVPECKKPEDRKVATTNIQKRSEGASPSSSPQARASLARTESSNGSRIKFAKDQDGKVFIEDSAAMESHRKIVLLEDQITHLLTQHPEEVDKVAKKNGWTVSEFKDDAIQNQMWYCLFLKEGKKVSDSEAKNALKAVLAAYDRS